MFLWSGAAYCVILLPTLSYILILLFAYIILYINSLVCLSRSSGPSQKADQARLGTSGLPDFHRPGPPWGVSGRVRHRRPAGSLVPCTCGTGTAVLWFPARRERGLEEERCAATDERRGGGGQRREEKKRREERGLEEERCVATGERRGGGGQRREEKKRREERGLEEERCAAASERRGGGGQRREEKSVAWRRSAALLQAKEEEEEDRGKKRREERS